MTDAATIQRDLRNIADCRTRDELDGYEAEARRRGIEPHEVTAILELRRARG